MDTTIQSHLGDYQPRTFIAKVIEINPSHFGWRVTRVNNKLCRLTTKRICFFDGVLDKTKIATPKYILSLFVANINFGTINRSAFFVEKSLSNLKYKNMKLIGLGLLGLASADVG